MDFHAMKRKKLQSLCKKHGIPANLKNQEMAHRLSLILNKGKENDVSCQSSSEDVGTDQGILHCVDGKDLLNGENYELNSNNGDNHQLVASDNVAGGSVEKFASSGKRSPSPNLEERVGFSPKHFKNSETKGLEPQTNLPPEITGDAIEICDVEENIQGGINKDQVDEIREDLDLGNVAMEESEKLVENIDVADDYVCETENVGDEVAKQGDISSPQEPSIKEQVENCEFGDYLGDKTDAQEEICGTGKVGAEPDKQDDSNSLQGSEMNDEKNPPHVSLEESVYPLVDGEAQKSDETICVHDDGIYNKFQESGSEVVDTMSFVDDSSIAAKDSHEKTDVNKCFPDEVHSSSFECSDKVSDQFLTINPPSEANASDLNIHQMVVSGNAAGNEDAFETMIVSSSGPLNELETKGLQFEMNLSPENEIEMCDVEEKEITQSDVNKEVLHAAAPCEVVMNNVDLGNVSLEGFGNHLVHKEESEKLADKIDLSEAEAENHDDTNMNYVNQEESGYPLVEEEVLRSDDTAFVHAIEHNNTNNGSEVDLMCLLDSHINAKDSDDGKANFTSEHFPDQVLSSNSEYYDVMPNQFQGIFPPSEVNSTDFNMHEMVASDNNEEKLESSQKKGLVADPEECIEFYSMHLEASEIEEFKTQTGFDPSALGDNVGTCNINNSMQSVETDIVSGDEGICQQKLGLPPESTPVAVSEKRSKFFPKVIESSMMKKELESEKNSALRTARDILGTCDMKENFNTAKKEQFGSTISKKTLTKRQPLQDLQQN